MAGRTVGIPALGSAHPIRRGVANPGLELLERFGYVVRGVLYGMMGLLALGIALRMGAGEATDQRGSLLVLINNPFGRPILIGIVVGLAAYSVWGLVRAAFDPLRRGADASGIAARLGFLFSGLSYAAITLLALQILGGASPASEDSVQKMASTLLLKPAGGVLTVAIGLVAVGAALGQFLEAYGARFRKDLKRSEMTAQERRVAVALGRVGIFARGITFLLVGWFLIDAGRHLDAARAHGFGGAFTFLLNQPGGHLLVGIVAVGFVALGLHSFACARWVRLLGSSG